MSTNITHADIFKHRRGRERFSELNAGKWTVLITRSYSSLNAAGEIHHNKNVSYIHFNTWQHAVDYLKNIEVW